MHRVTPTCVDRRGTRRAPTTCARLHQSVVVEQYQPREILTPDQARQLAAELIEAARLADGGPSAQNPGGDCTDVPPHPLAWENH